MDEKTNRLLERLRSNGHNPETIDGKTYRCAHCGRYAVIHTGEGYWTVSGSMLKGKCAGSTRSNR